MWIKKQGKSRIIKKIMLKEKFKKERGNIHGKKHKYLEMSQLTSGINHLKK